MSTCHSRAKSVVLVMAVLLVGAVPAGAVPMIFDLVGTDDPNLRAKVAFAYDADAATINIKIKNTSLAAAGPDPRFTAFAFNVPEDVTGIFGFLTPHDGWDDSYDPNAIKTPDKYGKYDIAGLTGPNFNGGKAEMGIPRDKTFEFTFVLTGSDLDLLSEASFLDELSFDASGPPNEAEQYFIGRFQRTGAKGEGSDVAIPGPPIEVAEPLSLLLFGSGLTGLWWTRRKKRS